MKREVKFRYVLKNIHTGEIHFKWYDLKSIERAGLSILFDVENYTILSRDRFTGLKDNNGIDIYEGDVLENPQGKKGIVIFMEGKFCLESKRRNNSIWFMPLDIGFMKNKEIIGNLHQK